jgi:pimeloyl-ACP methyl ester carboxylesterase
MAAQVRPQFAQVHDLVAKLGPVVAAKFLEFDGANDIYDVTFSTSTWRWSVRLDRDGKLANAGIMGPVAPPDPTLAPYASTKDSVRLPDGRTIHIVCMGRGSPLVILTPGGNDYSSVWNKVQPAVAKKTRVCAWERAGAGLSSPSPKPQTVAETTTDLQAALKAGGFAGPYVVVGHSRGAGETLVLKDREPSSVVGMVLVDPEDPDQNAERARLAPALAERERTAPNPLYAHLKDCAAAIRAGTARRGGPDPDNCFSPPGSPTNWPQELRRALEWHFAGLSPVAFAAYLDSRAAQVDPDFLDRDSAAFAKACRNYGDMPLVVLTAGDSTPPPADPSAALIEGSKLVDAQVRRDRDALAALSSQGVNRTVSGTTHMIPQIKPQAVIDAIDMVVDEAPASPNKQAAR